MKMKKSLLNKINELKIKIKKILLNKINELRIKKDMSADREYDGLSFSSSINKKIDMENLLNGDFLFCRPRSVDLDYKRRLIQSSTGGYYTHCAIYIGNGEIIDAVWPTIRKIKLAELLKEYRYIAALRIHGNEINLDRQEKIVNYAKDQINKKYDYISAISSPIREVNNVIAQHLEYQGNPISEKSNNQEDSFFCSQLLMEAALASGYFDHVQDEKYFQSSNWTPNGLAKFGYGDFLYLIGYLGDEVDENDYFLSGNMGEYDEY